MDAILKFLIEEDGPTAVEYSVMLGMIIIACLAGLNSVGLETSNSFTHSGDQIGVFMNGGGSGSGDQDG
jgi:pilus assembly protein Flp/PilA